MFENTFKNELLAFLPKEEVESLEQDITNIINKFPLDSKKRNYLNILINVFFRYRTHTTEGIEKIRQIPIFELGSNPKEITIKQNKVKINFLEFKNIDSYFTKVDLTNLDKFFLEIRLNIDNSFKSLDFSKNSHEQRLSQAINEKQSKIFDLNGDFYSYMNISMEMNNNEMSFADRMKNDDVLEKIHDMVRFYAWSRSTLTWSSFLTSEKEIQALSSNYQSLQWFLDGYIKRSTPFNVHSPKRYSQYLEALKNNDFKQYKKRIDQVTTFTNSFTANIKNLYSLLNNSPFAVQKENKSSLFDTFKKIVGSQLIGFDENSYSLQDINHLFKNLKTIFTDLNLSMEDFYDLDNTKIIDSILVMIVTQIEGKLLPIEFPFTLIWESKNKSLVDEYKSKYFNQATNLQILEFLVEYLHGGVSKENFSVYFAKMKNIAKIEDSLLKVGDLADFNLVKFEDAEYLTTKDGPYDFLDFKKLNEFENNIRQSLNNLKHLWVHEICGDPIFLNDPTFKTFFPLTLGKEKIEYVSEIETYLTKWNEYKLKSKTITKLQQTIKIVSTIKFKLEGEELVSSDYPGAISLVKAQKLIARENNRLLLKLKDLISTVLKFKYTIGMNNVLDPKILAQSDDMLITKSITILDQISNLKDEIISIDADSFQLELNKFSEFVISLLGSDSRIVQLKKFSDTFMIRYNKLKSDTVILNLGLHLTNLNDSVVNIISILKNIKESFEKFYTASFNKTIFDLIGSTTSSHNLHEIIGGIKSINEQMGSIVENLKGRFTDVSTYFDVYADLAFQIVQKYGRLISRNDLYSRLDNSRIKFYEEDGGVVITDKLDENASILEKQLFMEKTFSLFTIVSRSCNQINFAISKSFNNLVSIGKLPTDKLDRNFDVTQKVEIVIKGVDDHYKFLDSVKFPARKYIQSIKMNLKTLPNSLEPVKLSSKLVVELSNANKLINVLSKSKDSINYGLLRKLNESMTKIYKLIDPSVIAYFENLASNESKKQEILNYLQNDKEIDSYRAKLGAKLNKVRLLTRLDKTALATEPLEDLLNKQRQAVPVSVVASESESIQEIETEPIETENIILNDIDSSQSEKMESSSESLITESDQIEEDNQIETNTISDEIEEIQSIEPPTDITEPDVNQLSEPMDMDLNTDVDTYEPEPLDKEQSDEEDSGDLISEMEKLLNTDQNKKEKKDNV